MIITPDRDIYIESLDAGNPDVVRLWAGGARGGLPRGIPAANIYSFGQVEIREYRQLLEQGRNEAAAERRRRGLDREQPIAEAEAAGDAEGLPAAGHEAPEAAGAAAVVNAADQRR